MIAPYEEPEEVTISNDLDTLQKAVSIGAPFKGYIEVLPLDEKAAMIMNEEGKLIPLMPNRIFYDDVIYGTFYVVGIKDDEFVSLTKKQLKYYKKYFTLGL